MSTPDDVVGPLDDRLRSLIRTERFLPGERIGTERGLAERLGVPRSRLSASLDRLEAQGEIQRRLGRTGGVFRNDGRILRRINTTLGVPDIVRGQGLTLHTQVVRVETGLPHPDEQRALGLAAGDHVFRVIRVRNVDGRPWSLDRSVLPSARFPGLPAHDLQGSLYRLLHEEYGLVLDEAEESVEVIAADAAESEALQVPQAAPLLLFRRLARDEDNQVVEYAFDRFRADRTRVLTRAYGVNWKRVRSSS